MNLYHEFQSRVLQAVTDLQNQGLVPDDAPVHAITVEPPRDASHGDLATNAAMVLAKAAKIPPRQLAEKLVENLRDDTDIVKVDIAGPGFINLTLKQDVWLSVIGAVLQEGENYGRSQIGKGQKVLVEFVSVNPTGPLHIGHCRGAVFGDALTNLLKFGGYDVTKEYYVNDAGAQVDVLARSAFLRYREALGEEIGEIPEGLYPGEYLVPIGRLLAETHGEALRDSLEEEWLPIARDVAIAGMMDLIRADLAELDITFDEFFSERTLIDGDEDKVAATITNLRTRDLVYQGRLPPPKGKLPDDWEDREQTLFRATQFGDDVDRALIKSDGGYTYFASDMAYHRDKFARGFKHLINVWGADHSGYVKRMQAAVKALTDDEADLDIKICQLVHFLRDGKPAKMSKRAGTFITVHDVVEEVGAGALRFIMLFRKNDAPLDFDFVKVQEQSRDNPVFYVQYAHARAHSVLYRNLPDVYPDMDPDRMMVDDVKLDLLSDEGEIGLVKRLAQYPRIVEAAIGAHEPHRIAFYLHELAGEFHGQWNRGTDSPYLRFIRDDDREITEVRTALVAAIAKVIASGLGLLGVTAIREMR